VKAFGKELPDWLDYAATIEKKWPRRAAYAFLAIFAFGYVMSVTLLPTLEKNTNKQKV